MVHNILVVEDNPADVELIRIYLQQTEFRNKLFSTSSLGEGILFANENHIDIVLLDLNVKDSVGFNTIKKFRAAVPSVPVIVFTSMKNEIMGLQSVRAGAQDFLVKGDFDGRRLVKTIRYSLHRFDMQIQLQQEANDKSRAAQKMSNIQGVANLVSWEMEVVSSVMEWSEAMYHLLGLRPNVLQPSLANYMEYVYREDREKVKTFFEKATQTQEHNHIQHRFLINGKTIKHVSLSTKVIFDESDEEGILKLIGIIQDESDKYGGTQAGPLVKNSTLSAQQLHRVHNWDIGLSGQLMKISDVIYQMNKAKPGAAQRKLIQTLETVLEGMLETSTRLQGLHDLFVKNHKTNKTDYLLSNQLKLAELASKHLFRDKKNKLNLQITKGAKRKICVDRHLLDQYLLLMLQMVSKFVYSEEVVKLEVDATQTDQEHILLAFRWVFKGQINTVEEINGLLRENKLLIAYHKEEHSPLVDLGFAEAAMRQMGGTTNIVAKGAGYFMVESEVEVEMTPRCATVQALAPGGPLNVLLVEDHVLVRIKTKKQLLSWNDAINITEARNAEEAFDAFSNQPFDLVVLDLQLKSQSSWELVDKIKSLKDVPILGVANRITVQEQNQVLERGLIGCLSSPIEEKELFGLLDEHLKAVADLA